MEKPVRSVIENIQSFHSGLSVYFLSLKEKAKNQRAEMLLDYLSKREDYIASYLKEYLHNSSEKALELWIKLVPCLPDDIFKNCVKNLKINAALTVDDILDIAFHYDDCLIDFFNILVKETEFTCANTIFSTFLNQAIKDEKNLARDTLWFNDM